MMHNDILPFLKGIEGLKSTLRHSWLKSGRQESSAEHTWRVAIFFMLFSEFEKLDIDILKTLKMILIHDIPEVIDGDVPGFVKELEVDKYMNNEEKSAKLIFDKLPAPLNKEYFDLFVEFEACESKEARIAKSFDRIEGILQHVEAGPKTWNKEETGEHMLNYPVEAVKKADNKMLNEIWESIKNEVLEINKDIPIK